MREYDPRHKRIYIYSGPNILEQWEARTRELEREAERDPALAVLLGKGRAIEMSEE
jgi:hypothetical protein